MRVRSQWPIIEAQERRKLREPELLESQLKALYLTLLRLRQARKAARSVGNYRLLALMRYTALSAQYLSIRMGRKLVEQGGRKPERPPARRGG